MRQCTYAGGFVAFPFVILSHYLIHVTLCKSSRRTLQSMSHFITHSITLSNPKPIALCNLPICNPPTCHCLQSFRYYNHYYHYYYYYYHHYITITIIIAVVIIIFRGRSRNFVILKMEVFIVTATSHYLSCGMVPGSTSLLLYLIIILLL